MAVLETLAAVTVGAVGYALLSDSGSSRGYRASDGRVYSHKESPVEYAARKARNSYLYSGTNCRAYLASDGNLYPRKETQLEYALRHARKNSGQKLLSPGRF